jgi:hypothetical protein
MLIIIFVKIQISIQIFEINMKLNKNFFLYFEHYENNF